MNKRAWGNLLLLLTAMIWGTAFVAQRVGMDDIEPFTFNAARMALAALAVGVPALLRAKAHPPTAKEKKDTLLGGLCCGGFLAAASLFQQVGLVYTTAGKAGFLTAMYILLVPLLGALVLGRREKRRTWFAVALGVAGMYLLCVREGLTLAKGDALVCVCAVLYAGHILCCDRFSHQSDPIALSALQFAVTALLSLVLALLTEQPQLWQLRAAAVPILYCGLISGGLGYTMQMVAQRYTEPTVASLLMSLESVFAALSGALLLHEHMSARELSGCVILFAAILLVQLPERKRTRRAGL